MPAVQTTYGTVLAPAYEGMVANSIDHTIISYVVETAAGIGYGKAVVQGTTDNQVIVSAASKVLIGITEGRHDATSDTYAQYETVPVMVAGEIWVVTSVAVVAGDSAYVVPASGVFTNIATSNYVLPNGKFTSAGGIGALVKVRFG